jgi:putative transposase
VRFEFIHEHREEFNLEIMLRVLEVSKGGFYEWQKRPESKRTQTRKHLKDKIKTIHENSRNTYGAARVHACLLEENEVCCKPVVASIMREQGLKGKRKGRVKQKTTNSTLGPVRASNIRHGWKGAEGNEVASMLAAGTRLRAMGFDSRVSVL